MSDSNSTLAIPMLSIPEKKPSSVDLYNPIRNHIASRISKDAAESAEIELSYVREMRCDVEKIPSDQNIAALEARLELLRAYCRAISVIKSRLDVRTISFTWQDTFKTNKRATHKSMDYEKAAVIFNIGAVHSQIGVLIDRGTDEGRKRACVEFQKAAGAFRLLKENITVGKVPGPTTVDLTVDCAAMLEKLMLAHAQECYFDKAIADSKSPVICSKIAKQVGVFYEMVYNAISSQPLSHHFDKSFVSQVQLKAAYFYAEACYLYCTELHQKEEIGEEVARLKLGVSTLSDAKKSARGVPSSLLDFVTTLESNMKRNLARAEKENDQVYLVRVPPVGSLTELPAALLVKPDSMADALDISNENLFANFIPDFIKNSLDKYSKMVVDEVIKVQMDKMRIAGDIAIAKLSKISLTDSIVSVEKGFSMPVELKDEVEQIQKRGGSTSLEQEIKQLADLKRVIQELMVHIEEMLLKEESEDAQFRGQFAERWTRPESAQLNKNIKERLAKFAENLMEAGVNDSRIEQSILDNKALLAILDSKPIESALPSLAKPLVSLDGTEDEIVVSLKKSMSQLENLSQQRACFEDKLNEMKAADDILPDLLSKTAIGDSLFNIEVKKYDPICDEISQNIKEQEELLTQVQVKNDKFAALFNLEEFKVAYEGGLEQIDTAIAKFHEIKQSITEGIKFYIKLQDTLVMLEQQCGDFVMSRNLESQDKAEMLTNGSVYHGWT